MSFSFLFVGGGCGRPVRLSVALRSFVAYSFSPLRRVLLSPTPRDRSLLGVDCGHAESERERFPGEVPPRRWCPHTPILLPTPTSERDPSSRMPRCTSPGRRPPTALLTTLGTSSTSRSRTVSPLNQVPDDMLRFLSDSRGVRR